MSEEMQIEIVSQEILNNNEIIIEIVPNLENGIKKLDDVINQENAENNDKSDEECILKNNILDGAEHFINKINLLQKDIELFQLKLETVENLLQEKIFHNNNLQEDLKNKESILNNKNEKINELNIELEEIKHKNKQQNMVSLLTKLKTNEIKVPIVVEKEIEPESNDNIKYPDKTKALLIKRRKNVF
jgi:hypothetical protein